ncbi:GNAT family N-acetyltransferase [Horticoccus luteus]|uniref:GNAT family N-acetyltransferase n=1 Tax=Horticoccus luteus TaxID=2862869 RepID=A0A8F9TTZ2_9BACT|nr:GNAT family protein [Horticoccus luteus]QYM79005.1 GNAT family N-acetyltransferase [Horticoccus luteus]
MIRPPETFTTARLLARPPRVADAPQAFAVYASDPVATRYLSFPAYQAVTPLEEFFHTRENVWAGSSEGPLPWMLFLRDDPTQLVGSIGVTLNDRAAVFGYAIGRAYWGRGLTAEALTWLVDWALAQPGIFRAWAFCDAENLASARVMEKAGMLREGVLRRWHIAPNISPEPRDCLVYAKVR